MPDLDVAIADYLSDKPDNNSVGPLLQPSDIYPILQANPDLTVAQTIRLCNRVFGFKEDVNDHDLGHALYAVVLGHMGYRDILPNGHSVAEVVVGRIESVLRGFFSMPEDDLKAALVQRHVETLKQHPAVLKNINGEQLVLSLASQYMQGSRFSLARIGKFCGGDGYYPALRKKIGLNIAHENGAISFWTSSDSDSSARYGYIDNAWVLPEGLRAITGFNPSFLDELCGLLAPAIKYLTDSRGDYYSHAIGDVFTPLCGFGPSRRLAPESAMFSYAQDKNAGMQVR